jgi:hypothetical protein
MAKSKKRRKNVTPPSGGYKKFINDMINFVNSFDPDIKRPFSETEKKRIYSSRLQMRRPDSTDKTVSVRELDKIYAYIKSMHRKPKTEVQKHKISTYQLLLYYSYNMGLLRRCKKEWGEGHIESTTFEEATNKLFGLFAQNYIIDTFAAITRLSNPTHKYYSFLQRTASFVNDDLRFEIVSEVSGIPAQKKYIDFKGHYRPAYRLGKTSAKDGLDWIVINNDILPQTKQTEHQSYTLYMQAHALNRMKERLDLLDKESINYSLWQNTATITDFIIHKGFLLVPFKVYEIRVGYFVVEPVEDMLVIKTFLFITHNCTPEGDKLKEITGLGKSDISYWKIDRLSTFINLDEEKYPKLMQLFTNAGMQDLAQLKDKEFDIESIQTANLDKLRQYIENSMQYKNAKEEDVVIHV